MKVLFIGIIALNEKVDHGLDLLNTPSLYDFDAVVVDSSRIWPLYLNCRPGSSTSVGFFQNLSAFRMAFAGKAREALHLLNRGGIIVCLLQPLAVLTGVEYRGGRGGLATESMNQYEWLPVVGLSELISQGRGERITRTHSSPFDDYLKLDKILWVAHLEDEKSSQNFEILATNKADFPVACRIKVGRGSIFLLPYATHQNFSEIILNCLAKASGGPVRRTAPDWIASWMLPGEEELGKQISDVTQEITTLQSRTQDLKDKLYELSLVKNLLYERDSPLEDAVKVAFKELGLNLEREGDKDFVVSGTEGRVIFEVTGSEGFIDVDKFRQLLDYLTTENKEGGTIKSILVGNSQIDISPEKRGEPFTQKAVAQSKVHDTCLLPTVELYRAIVLVRQGSLNPKEFWKELVGTSGVFSTQTSNSLNRSASETQRPQLVQQPESIHSMQKMDKEGSR